jgi:hypothetical protein
VILEMNHRSLGNLALHISTIFCWLERASFGASGQISFHSPSERICIGLVRICLSRPLITSYTLLSVTAG